MILLLVFIFFSFLLTYFYFQKTIKHTIVDVQEIKDEFEYPFIRTEYITFKNTRWFINPTNYKCVYYFNNDYLKIKEIR